MKKTEVILATKKLRDASERLIEGVREAKNPLEIDGAIQRFELTFELLWKTLKIALEYYGIRCNNPRTCIKQAFKNSLICLMTGIKPNTCMMKQPQEKFSIG